MRTLLLFLLGGTAALYAQDCPKDPGVYYLSSSEWKSMTRLTASGVKTTGFAQAAFTYHANVSQKFRDAEAPVTLTATPSFCIVQIDPRAHAGDIEILRLTKKKNSRELQVGQAGVFSGMSTGTRDQDVQPGVKVTEISPVVIRLQVSLPLKPGQYAVHEELGKEAGFTAYDFGVLSKRE